MTEPPLQKGLFLNVFKGLPKRPDAATVASFSAFIRCRFLVFLSIVASLPCIFRSERDFRIPAMVYGSLSVLCICLIVGYCCGAFPAIYPKVGIIRMDGALEIAEKGRTVLSNVVQLGAEPAILILDTLGDVFCVALGLCVCMFILVAVIRASQWGGKVRRQHMRRVNRAFKTHSCRPNPPRSLAFTPTSVSAWVAAILVVSIIGTMYVCVQMPIMLPPADAHHHSTTITLPPSQLPTHPQWFEPAKRNHVHWMEDFGSSISSTITASRHFWTLKLPTNPGTDTQIATPQQCLADSTPGLYAAFHPHLCFNNNSYRADQSSSIAADLMHMPAHVCMGGTAAAAAATGQSSIPIIRLHYTPQPAVPASNTSVPAPALLLRSKSNFPTVPATAVAIYTPIAAVDMCAATFTPTAVVLPSTTAAGQAALDNSKESTAVALYTTTPPFMAWANIFWPIINSGSPTMVTLPLSDSSVESIFNYKQDPEILPPMTTNIHAAILPQLPASLHRSAAGRDNVNPAPERSYSTAIVLTANDASWAMGRAQSLLERACPSSNLLAYLTIILLLLAGLRSIAVLMNRAMKQSVYTGEWKLLFLSKKIRWSIHVVDS